MSDLDDLYPNKTPQALPPSYSDTVNDSSSSDHYSISIQNSTASTSHNYPTMSSNLHDTAVSNHNYPDPIIITTQHTTQPQIQQSLPEVIPQQQYAQTPTTFDDMREYQKILDNPCYNVDFFGLCLSCFCPYCVSGCNQSTLRGSSTYFWYGCCLLDCCCCCLTKDIERTLGMEYSNCCYVFLCHIMCRCVILSQQRAAINQWVLAGKPHHIGNGIVMS